MRVDFPFALVFGFAGLLFGFVSSDLKTGDEVLVPGPSKVLFIGNTIEDFYARVEDTVVARLGVKKGEFSEVTKDAFDRIGGSVGVAAKNAGGSSANTSRAYCYLGGHGTFVGVCGSDSSGVGFKKCLREYGVDTSRIVTRPEGDTNRAYCLATPDGERTMYFLPGSASDLTLSVVPAGIVDDFAFYVANALNFITDNGVTLSHAMVEETLVRRKGLILLLANLWPVKNRTLLLRPVADKATIISGTVAEFRHLYDIEEDEELFAFLEARTAGERPLHKVVVATMGGAGAYIFYHGGRYFVEPSAPKDAVVDTTGAGDFFAGGMLYGLLNGYTVKTSAEFARTVVGGIITKMGTLLDDGVRAKVDALKASVGRA